MHAHRITRSAYGMKLEKMRTHSERYVRTTHRYLSNEQAYVFVCISHRNGDGFDESERNIFEHRIHRVQLSFLRHRLRLYVIRSLRVFVV